MRKVACLIGITSLALASPTIALADPPADPGWGLPPPGAAPGAPPGAPPANPPGAPPPPPPGAARAPNGPAAPPPPPPGAGPETAPAQGPRGAPPPAPPRYAPAPPPYDPSDCPPTGHPPCPSPVRVAPLANGRLHDGFFLRLGLPFVASRVKYAGRKTINDLSVPRPPDATLDSFGLGFDFSIGGTPASGFVLAFDLSGVVNQSPSVSPSTSRGAFKSLSYSRFGLLADWYPNPRQGLHLMGGVGLSQLMINPRTTYQSTDPELSDTDRLSGMYFLIGIGHEWWVSQQWSIGLLLRAEGSSMKSSGSYEPISADASFAATSLGVTFTYH